LARWRRQPSAHIAVCTGRTDSPLLETGDLRDSIERDVQHGVAYVGSNNPKALWHEFGTSRIPPRPFLEGAANAKHAEIGKLIGQKFHALLIKA
jgi:phage gpG-like protein